MTAVGSVFPFLEPDDAQRRAAAIESLTLDGRSLDAKVADAIQDIPFERSIEGASTVTLKLVDPDGDLLDSGLFSAAVDLELPLPGLGARAAAGLPLARGEVVGYRLGRIGPGAPVLSLEFRERIVVLLTRHTTPLKASRADMTRAEFIRMMVREVKAERIRFWSPELHARQPIGKRRDLTPKTTKKDRRSPGFGSTVPKVKGKDATRAQTRILEAVLDTGLSHDLNRRELIGLVEGVTQESTVSNPVGQKIGTTVPITGQLVGGHRINVGAWQQDSRYWPASRDVARDTAAFVAKFKPIARANKGKSIGWCVDQVQRSFTFGSWRQGTLYDQWQKEAADTVDAYEGNDTGAGLQSGTPYAQSFLFRRGEPNADPHTEPEDSWTASGRLASDVNFRRFADLGVIHYVSDDYLIRAAPRLAIKRRDLPAGVLSVTPQDFDVDKPRVNGRPPEASIRVDCYVDVLEPVIGSVWTVSGYGPLDGRYLVTNVRGSYLRPISTVTLSLPVPKLPEPAGTLGTRQRDNADTDARPVRGRGDLAYPLAVHGRNLGGVAAHHARAWGNWQSDNAVDIGVSIGTKVFAVDDGTIEKLGGAWDGTGNSNPNGYNVTIRSRDNRWFYTHLKQRKPISVGDKVVKGQLLGYSGAANGVQHLHIASEKGDPEKMLGVDRFTPAPQTSRPDL